jgi:MFS family permease
LYNTIIGLATIVGSLVGGFLAKTVGYGVCFGLGAILASLVAAGLWWLPTIMPAQKERRAGEATA